MKTLVLLLSLAVSSIVSAAERMNVLLIISDDMRTELGCYASTLAKSPNLDKLSATSMRFERAYCQFPLCNPSRASMLTGRHPQNTGVLGNRTWFGDLHPDLISLPKHFKQNGYTTIRVGKIFHGGIDDTDAWSIDGQPRYLAGVAKDAPPSRRKQPSPLRKDQRSDRRIVLKGQGEEHADYRAADRTIRYLREMKERNQLFFIGCGFLKPHTPLEAPQRFYDLWQPENIPLPPDFAPRPTVPPGFPAGAIRPRNADLFIGRDASPQEARETIRAYLASAAFMDWNVGRVLDALKELGLAENTLVVFWGDHGFQLGEKGKWSKAGSLWEQGTRTPLILRDPRLKTAGQTCRRVVQMIDLYPTLVDLCGLTPPPGLEGRNLRPLLEDPNTPWNHPAYTVWSEDSRHFTGVMIRTEQWRYAEFFGRGAGRMLLDPAADPHEMTNLADQPEHQQRIKDFATDVRRYAGDLLLPADRSR